MTGAPVEAVATGHASAGPVAAAPPTPGPLRVHAARREGRGHRRRGEPCQDAHATWTDGRRAVVAVADGLGSCPLSQHGSQAAADAAVAHLASAPVWDDGALREAFAAARQAVERQAQALQAPLQDLATTLQVALRDGTVAWAAMVGDGGIVVGDTVLLAPLPGGYANEVVPLTASDWADHVRIARHDGPGATLVFTDGLVRLLLRREAAAWVPFSPFFSAFLPALATGLGAVDRFLARADVDAAWDDDKALAVIA